MTTEEEIERQKLNRHFCPGCQEGFLHTNNLRMHIEKCLDMKLL